LARFENDRTISFIPPDGAFDLMTYRLSTQVRSVVLKAFLINRRTALVLLLAFDEFHGVFFQVKPLIWVEAQVEKHSRSRVEIMVKARSQFKERRYEVLPVICN
jgi:AP-1 complex subunit mu